MENPDRIELEGVVTYATAKAIRFQADYWEQEEWLPRSQVEITELEEGKVRVRIAGWLAKKNGWHE